MLVGTVGTRRDADVSAAALPRLLIAFAAAVGFDLATRSKHRGAPSGVLLGTQKKAQDAGLRVFALNLAFLLITLGKGKAGDGALALGPHDALSRRGCAPTEVALLRTKAGDQTGLTELLAFAGALCCGRCGVAAAAAASAACVAALTLRAGILSAASGRNVYLGQAASCLRVKSPTATNRGLAGVCPEALERVTGLTPAQLCTTVRLMPRKALRCRFRSGVRTCKASAQPAQPDAPAPQCFTSLLTPQVVAVHRLAILRADAAHAGSVLAFYEKAKARLSPDAAAGKLKAAARRAAEAAKALAAAERAATKGPHAAFVAAAATLSGDEVEAALQAHAPKAWLQLREPAPPPRDGGGSRGRGAVAGASAGSKRRRSSSAAATRTGGRDATPAAADAPPRRRGLRSHGAAASLEPPADDAAAAAFGPAAMELRAASPPDAPPHPMLLDAGGCEFSAGAGFSLPPGFEAETLLLDDADDGASAWPATWPASTDAAFAAAVLSLFGGGPDAPAAESVARRRRSVRFSAGVVAPALLPPPPAGAAAPRATRAAAARRLP